ncbi:hypothetical protein JMF89_14215, partial [Clostridiaceae bacterium UIB06]|nr:hypothetical protein [Clostridiaceae bacterium UIB06]
MSEGKFGDYIVTQVEVLKDKTLVHYECTKLLSEEAYNLTIVDDSEKEYQLDREKVKVQDNNKFIAEIAPLSKNKKYKLKAIDLEKQYDVREDLKFTVEV